LNGDAHSELRKSGKCRAARCQIELLENQTVNGRESVLASHSWISSYMDRKTSGSGILFCQPLFRLAGTLSLPLV
jgi:hypothetical protein